MVDLDALVLPAFDNLEGVPSEAAPWRERHDLEHTVEIPGLPAPLAHDGHLGVVPTGIGKAAAATTVTALLSSPVLDISEALVCSVGVAGGPPEIPVGSVVVADTVLDWDDKCRFGGGDLALDPYTGDQGVFELDADLVERARAVAVGVELSHPAASNEQPVVTGGVNLCGDELWHGAALANQVGWLLDERGVGEYRATEMEDAGTASALARFGRLDRYLTVRGISNHDRPADGGDPAESLFDPAFESGFGVAAENATRVAGAVLDDIRDVS